MVPDGPPTIYIPGFAQRSSGLLVPIGDLGREVRVRLDPIVPAELRPSPAPVAVVDKRPEAFDSFLVYLDEAAVGLPVSTHAQLQQIIGLLPFELAMIIAAKLGTHVDHMRSDAVAQLELATDIYGEFASPDSLRAFTRNEAHLLFCEQQFFVLMRELILGADDRPLTLRLSATENLAFSRALIATLSVEDVREIEPRDDWLPYLVQNAAYNAHEPLSAEMARAFAMFVDIPERTRAATLVAQLQKTPLDTWMGDYHMTIAQQLAAAIALITMSGVLDDTREMNSRCLIEPAQVAEAAARVGVSVDDLLATVSGDRAWFREAFDSAKLDSTSAIWDRLPFEQRPFLRLDDGRLLVLHPRCIASWICDGFFYRLDDAARRRGQTQSFRSLVGGLTEQYALGLMREVHPSPRPVGAGVVHGEQGYGGPSNMEKHTPDIAIDYGQDLIVMEVSFRPLSIASIRGDEEATRRDLDRMLGEKIDPQLTDRIEDILSGAARIPDVEIRDVKRIWPVVVTANGLLLSPPVIDYIRGKDARLRSLAKVMPLTVIDIADLEQISGLVEGGESVLGLLRAKAFGPYADMDFRRFVNGLHPVPGHRSSHTQRRYEAAWQLAINQMGFDEQVAVSR